MDQRDFRILGLAASLRRASFHRGIVMPESQMLIPFSLETGNLMDEETRERLRRFLSALAAWTQRLEAPMKANLHQALLSGA